MQEFFEPRILTLVTFLPLAGSLFLCAVPPDRLQTIRWAALGISLLNFLWAGLLTLGIAWITVSYQSFKAARINPVKSLRSE